MVVSFQLILLPLFILLFSTVISLNSKIGTVYKLQCQITGKIYIGRTTAPIDLAIRSNLSNFKRYNHGTYKNKDSCFEVLANKDYNVTVVEIIYKLSNDTDFSLKLRKLQRFHVDQYDDVVNKRKPSRTKREYYVEKIDNILEYKKTYYENNREVMSQQNKENYWDKRESLLKQKKVRYQLIKSSLLQKVTCEVCGGECAMVSLYMHKKTKRHLTALAKLNSEASSEASPQYEQQLNQLLNAQMARCDVCDVECTKAALSRHKKSKRHLTALAKLNQSDAFSSEPE